MPKPISLDLRDLTDAKIKRARKNLGTPEYCAPCIIGTLLTPAKREEFDGLADYAIDTLIKRGVVAFPDNQEKLAKDLQRAFDLGFDEEFDEMIAKVRKLPPKVSAA